MLLESIGVITVES